MCGIVGFITREQVKNNDLLEAMTDEISHRGPDGRGHFFYNNVGLGHRRLSIVDLSKAGHQPMHYLDRYTITYNGEVYNYVELREELEAEGYKFDSQTDTEVILAAYDRWGKDSLNKFNGMWAFAIFDKQKDELFLSRDRFGIKPLYYCQHENDFIFASEIKSILKHPSVLAAPNRRYISDYLSGGPKEYESETAFEGIYRFPFSSYVFIKRNNSCDTLLFSKFWELKPNTVIERFSFEKAKQYAKQYYDLLSDSVRLRLRADVKVGSALSGGLDSSSIVYLVNQQLKSMGREELQETFSSVYKSDGTQDCDESEYIDLLAKELNVNSNQIEPNEGDIPDEVTKLLRFMENPPDSTCMSGWYTFKKVKDKGVAVTLDGQGADEQLSGYLPYLYVYLSSISLIDLYKELPYFFRIPGASKFLVYAFVMAHFKALFGEIFLKWAVKKIKDIDIEVNLNRQLCNDVQTSLITLIHYSDRVSMGHSIESRMPFMDYRLVEFLANVPACYKMHNGWTKYLARLAFDKKLPDKICWRKDKMGWPIPEEHWFRGGLQEWFVEQVNMSSYFSESEKSNFLTKFHSGGNINILIRYLNVALLSKNFLEK